MTVPVPISAIAIDLTPQRPVPMGGYGGRERVTRSIHGRIEANFLSIGEGRDAVVLASLDTLFVGATLRDRIIGVCATRFGVGADRVLALASHTHFSPMLDESKPMLGRTDEDELHRWGEEIEAAILSAPTQAAVSARVGVGVSDRAVNRRLRWTLPTLRRLAGKTRGDIYMADNPSGRRAPGIRTCVWLSPTGDPVAALWSWACHPVSFPEADTASADYVGVVRDALRLQLGARLPVVFAPGCMGDVRPRSAKPWPLLSRFFRLAVFGPTFVPYDHVSWEKWARGLANEVTTIDAAGVTVAIDPTPGPSAMVTLPMTSIFAGSSRTPELHAKAIHAPGFGRILALSCEPVTAIAAAVSTSDDDLVIGYEGDVFGYLPTEAMIAEGGYEPRGSHAAFGLVGDFRPGLDRVVANIGRTLDV